MKVPWSSKVFCTSNYASFLILVSLGKKIQCRAVTKILSFQVHITSRQRIKQLGIFLVLFFFYFFMKVAGGHLHSSRGNSPAPALRVQLHIKT